MPLYYIIRYKNTIAPGDWIVNDGAGAVRLHRFVQNIVHTGGIAMPNQGPSIGCFFGYMGLLAEKSTISLEVCTKSI